jgi:hypothetical protein
MSNSSAIPNNGGTLNTNDLILAIDTEIGLLQKVRALLIETETTAKRKRGRPAVVSSPNKATSFNPAAVPTKPKKRRPMSTEGRAKIAAGQKARWAKSRKTAKRVTPKAASTPAKNVVAAKTIARKTGTPGKSVATKQSGQSKVETIVTAA